MTKLNIRLHLIINVILCCLLFSCGDDYNSSGRNSSSQSHDYGPKDKNSTLQDKYQNNDFSSSLGDGSNRWIWQKPNLIIEHLEPLENKVVADIGAGPYGYFSLRIAHQTSVKKVIAMDIDNEAIEFMERARKLLPGEIQSRFESRLVESNNAMLRPNEADVVLIVNTSSYFENRVQYFKDLLRGIVSGGKLVVIDFKKKNTPVGPNVDERISLGQIEQDLKEAGYKKINSDDRTLDYQYIVTAYKE